MKDKEVPLGFGEMNKFNIRELNSILGEEITLLGSREGDEYYLMGFNLMPPHPWNFIIYLLDNIF